MQTIEFLHPYPPYNAGERASFDEGAAAALVARGIAAACEAPASAAPPVSAGALPAEASPPPLAPAKGKKA
jgi:hypothetical protein